MKAVLRSVEAIRPLVRRRKSVGATLLAEGHPTYTLLEIPSPRMIGAYSLPQVMWALAEYYKAPDQWSASWPAAKIVAAVGITRHTPRKLQTGIRMIGVSQYASLDLLGVICDHWGNLLAAEVARCGVGS